MSLSLLGLLLAPEKVFRRYTSLAISATLRLDEASEWWIFSPKLHCYLRHRCVKVLSPACRNHATLCIVALHVNYVGPIILILRSLHRIVLHALFEGSACLDLIRLRLEIRLHRVVVIDKEFVVAGGWNMFTLFLYKAALQIGLALTLHGLRRRTKAWRGQRALLLLLHLKCDTSTRRYVG